MIIPTKRNLKSNKKSNKNFPQKKKKKTLKYFVAILFIMTTLNGLINR